jgi:hypothetical protein
MTGIAIEKIQSYWLPEQCGVEVNERADSKAKQSIREGRDSQLLLQMADLNAKEKERQSGASHFISKHQKRQRRKLL